MIPLVMYETVIAARRTAWPVALALHAAAAVLFLGIWGATGGVPLWRASVLAQLATIDRVVLSVILTWLCGYVLTDGRNGERQLLDWSALTGQTPERVFGARIAAATVLAIVCTSVAAPAFVAAGEAAAIAVGDAASHLGAAFGFALLCVGVTALATVAIANRIVGWSAAMCVCLIAAVGVRVLDTTLLRGVAPTAAGLAAVLLAIHGVRSLPAESSRVD